jgi:hypothetical protein
MGDIARRRALPRIKLVDGEWYAFGGTGNKYEANALLAEAISFCNRLNNRIPAWQARRVRAKRAQQWAARRDRDSGGSYA